MATKWMNLIGPNWDIKTSIAVLQRIIIFYDYQRKTKGWKNKQYLTFGEELWRKKEAKYKKFCKKYEMSKEKETGGTSERSTCFQHLCKLQLPEQHSFIKYLLNKVNRSWKWSIKVIKHMVGRGTVGIYRMVKSIHRSWFCLEINSIVNPFYTRTAATYHLSLNFG